jgi:hypothetical protein
MNSDKYFRLAKECIQFAAVVDEEHKASLLALAEKWLKLADSAANPAVADKQGREDDADRPARRVGVRD